MDTIVEGLERAPPVPGRLSLQPMEGGWTLIDDSYNANPGSTAAAIDTLALAKGERWLLLGDMAELGPDAARLHAQVGELARARGIDRLYATGPLSASAVQAFGEGARHFDSQQALADAAIANLKPGVTVLIKGSRSSAMERVVAVLVKHAKGGSDAA